MSRITRGQKLRLGFFLLAAGALLVGTIVTMVGSAILEKRDPYVIRFKGSTSGLDVGAPVRYNGVPMGRVERIRVNEEDVTGVEVHVSMKHGTPIKEDTTAVLAMQGITGLKSIELAGGSNESALLATGSEIKSVVSTLDMLGERVESIAGKLEQLVDNLVDMTGGETQTRLTSAVKELEATAVSIRSLIDTANEKAQRLDPVVDRVEVALDGFSETMTTTRESLTKISNWVNAAQVSRVMGTVQRTTRAIGDRMAAEEMGQTLEEIRKLSARSTELVSHVDIALLRVRDDLGRALDEFVIGAESFSEFAQLLRDNPSALLRGRSEKARRIE